jgi:hypothetical protein
MRYARSTLCASTAGFQLGSMMTTRSAAVSVSPRPPTCTAPSLHHARMCAQRPQLHEGTRTALAHGAPCTTAWRQRSVARATATHRAVRDGAAERLEAREG